MSDQEVVGKSNLALVVFVAVVLFVAVSACIMLILGVYEAHHEYYFNYYPLEPAREFSYYGKTFTFMGNFPREDLEIAKKIATESNIHVRFGLPLRHKPHEGTTVYPQDPTSYANLFALYVEIDKENRSLGDFLCAYGFAKSEQFSLEDIYPKPPIVPDPDLVDI